MTRAASDDIDRAEGRPRPLASDGGRDAPSMEGSPRSRPLSFGFAVLAGGLLVAAGYVLSLVVTRDESFGDPRILFLETRPRLFGFGLVSALTYAVALALFLKRQSKARL